MLREADVWDVFSSSGITSLSELMAHTPVQPQYQSLHTDLQDWNTLTDEEQFYALLASQPYNTNQESFLTNGGNKDYRLTRSTGVSSSYDYMAVYEEIPLTNDVAKDIVFCLKGSDTLFDYITDASLLHSYASSGVSEAYDYLYNFLFETNYNAILNYMSAQATPTLHNYHICGHSLGGMLAYDIYHRLVDENAGGNFDIWIYNPYTLISPRFVDSLQDAQNAVDGVDGYGRFTQMQTNIHAFICRGDFFAASYINYGPGMVKTLPEKEPVGDVDNLDISNIAWNASQELANHKLSNFYENLQHTTLTLLGETFYNDDMASNQYIHDSVLLLSNDVVRDFSGLRASVGEYHVKVRAVDSDFDNIVGNVFYDAEVDRQDYQWEFSQIPGQFHCYYESGSNRIVTPIYQIVNNRYKIYFTQAHGRHSIEA